MAKEEKEVVVGHGVICQVVAYGKHQVLKSFLPKHAETFEREDVQDYIRWEVLCLRRLKQCKHVVNVKHVFPCWTKYTMPRLRMTLYHYMHHTNDRSFLPKLLHQMLLALQACERHRILHTDIKPDNIMLDEGGDFQLIDFGRSVETDWEGTVGDSDEPPYGALAVSSPETLRMILRHFEKKPVKKGFYVDHRSDVYSLGVVLLWCGLHKWVNDPPKAREDEDRADIVRMMLRVMEARNGWGKEREAFPNETVFDLVVHHMVGLTIFERKFAGDLLDTMKKKLIH